MKISFWMIVDRLNIADIRYNMNNKSEILEIQGCLPYEPGMEINQNYVYITKIEEFKNRADIKKGYWIILGKSDIDHGNHFQWIECSCKISVYAMLEKIQKIFTVYDEWNSAIHKEILHSGDLWKLCNLTQPLLENPIYVFDSEYVLLAISGENAELKLEQASSSIKMLSIDQVTELKSDPEYMATIGIDTAQISSSKLYPIRALFVNFNNSPIFPGRIVIDEMNRKFKESDKQIAEILTQAITTVLKQKNRYSDYSSRSLQQLIIELLSGEGHYNDRLDYFCQHRQWQQYDRYLCLKIGVEEKDIATAFTNYSYIHLEKTIGQCCSFFYDNSIVCIIHLGETDTPESIIHKLSYFLRDAAFRCGISRIYEDITDSRSAFLQASIALKQGSLHNYTHWYHHFDDYSMIYLYKKATEDLPIELFCNKNLFILKSEKDEVDYYNTLKVFLENNMSIAQSAEKLYIHRTTMYHRLKHIENLIDCDLNDPKTRFHLQLSYKLLEMDEKYK